MTRIVFFAAILCIFSACSTTRHAMRDPSSAPDLSELQTRFSSFKYGNKEINVRIGVQNPEGPILGDILYVHGFADRLDNHEPLFHAWTQAGFRVIAFDLPSHGEDRGDYDNLNNFSFKDLAELAAKVEQDTKPSTNRPLILSGWSTGGLIVVRMLQENWTTGLSRPVSGAILFAPGVSVRKFPWTFGNRLGQVTEATLTHNTNPPHVAPISPTSPFWSHLVFEFAPRLVTESLLSQHDDYPTNVPTLVFTGGDSEDMYAKEWVVREWISEQNVNRKTTGNPLIVNISCPHAKHELDNEPESYGGLEVRNSSASFAKLLVIGNLSNFAKSTDTYGPVCSQEPPPNVTELGNSLQTFWVLSDSYKQWYKSSPRNISDPHLWPKEFSPEESPVFSHNEIFISRSPDVVFAQLLRAQAWPDWYPNAGAVKIAGYDEENKSAELAQGSEFNWVTFGTQQKSKVTLFRPNKAIGWTADSFGVQAYHRWLLYAEKGGTRVVTEECDNGFTLDTIVVPMLLNPGLHASHQVWLENLKVESEKQK